MTREITLEELASGGEAAEAAAEAAAEGEAGEWALELYERLQEDGMLQAILWGPDALPDGEAPAAPDAAALEAGAGPTVDAETVADALEDVKEQIGDLRISQLIKLTRDNPELVDRLLEEHLASDSGADPENADPDEEASPDEN